MAGSKLRVAAMALAVVCVLAATARADDVVRLLAHEYRPFFAERPMPGVGLPGMGRGFCTDMVTAAYAAVGVRCSFTFEPMLRSQHSLRKHEYTALVGSTHGPLDEYPEGMLDSVRISGFRLYFHYFKSRFDKVDIRYSGLQDLRGYRIASIQGSPVRKALDAAGLTVETVRTPPHGLKMLVAGNADFWVAVGVSARRLVAELQPELLDDLASIPASIYDGDVAVNFDTMHPDYALRRRQLNEGLRAIVQNGLYGRIMKSYFPVGDPPGHLLLGR